MSDKVHELSHKAERSGMKKAQIICLRHSIKLAKAGDHASAKVAKECADMISADELCMDVLERCKNEV